ncbi:tetratricopeptide repeat protein [Actinokineospora sp. NBRC 105648]|uniref:ATP-binding protein n=1 Tax=Actinokineospora sp. NBRC 105648 TaxID=3032206 RepID=UPI002556A7EF|nr:tetratricopeptide repeat protein [Actinokineospora sp. NBRC 105648]
MGQGIQHNHFHGVGPVELVVPAVATNTLPRDVRTFVGREPELARLTGIAAQARNGDAANVVVIEGMAGVGKTALAVRVAHAMRKSYPDSTLYVNLHAHSADRAVIHPASALETLLHAVGTPATEIPAPLDARAALWRARVADRRVLLVLDNAADDRQVLPLLPGTASCFTLITSRRRLFGVPDAVTVPLPVLDESTSLAMFEAIVGADRLRAAAADVRRIVRQCAHLPLAVALCAARLGVRRTWDAGMLAERLERAADRLAELGVESDNVANVFESSYRDLDEPQRRVFHAVGLHATQDFGPPAVAALFGARAEEVAARLDELVDRNLLQEQQVGRYLAHDLLHGYAREVATRESDEPERALAVDRMLDYYTFVTCRADRYLDLLGNRELSVEHVPADVPRITTHAEAVDWLETERATLHACLLLALETGRGARAARLARAMVYFLRLKGYWGDVLQLCESVVDVCTSCGEDLIVADMAFYRADILRLTRADEEALRAYDIALSGYRRLGDRHREARTLHSIGDIERNQGGFAAALDSYAAAMAIYRELGNDHAEARARHSTADAYRLAGRPDEALDGYQRLLDDYARHDDQVGAARVHYGIAELRLALGRPFEAAASARTALVAFEQLGDRLGEADARLTLGGVHASLGERAEAERAFTAASIGYRELNDLLGEARAARGIGSVRCAAGDTEGGAAELRVALALFERAGAAEIGAVRAELERCSSD